MVGTIVGFTLLALVVFPTIHSKCKKLEEIARTYNYGRSYDYTNETPKNKALRERLTQWYNENCK